MWLQLFREQARLVSSARSGDDREPLSPKPLCEAIAIDANRRADENARPYAAGLTVDG
jgi:hypothetical protein